ncbi:MAG: hypothetical protein LAE24_12440 [Candidatus Contendobacter sp.]|nr:hypothetical protein [Candidatus Contendobacter sp.]
MQEILEQVTFHVRSMWRYRWYAMALMWLAVLIGWIILFNKPITYTANAKVYVDESTVLQSMFKGFSIEQDTTAIIELMARQLVSRPNLEQVARAIRLDRQAKTDQELETLLTRLEKDILVESSRTSEGMKQRNFYVISYSNSNPQLAKQLVRTLIDNFVEKTVGESLRDSDAARRFLDQQLKEYKDNFIVVESRVREFKRQHADELPEQTNYFERLQAAQAALNDVELKITEAEFQRNDLQRQLGKMAITINSTLADDSRLLALRKQLDELLVKYTENHPNVIATKRSIAEFEEQQKAVSPDARKNLVIPNSAEELLKVKLGEVESGIAVLQVRKKEYLHRVNNLRKMNKILPNIERELQILNQDYETTKKKYDALLERQDSATMTGSIGQSGEKIRFKIIDPPRIIDAWPTKALHLLLRTSMVLVMSFFGGLAVAFFLSQFKPVIYGQRMLEELTELPVFGDIPRVENPKARMRNRLDLVAFIVIGLIMLGTHGIAVFKILDTIKTVMMQELGDRR